MRIQSDRDVFTEAVAWAARSLPSRPASPLLAGMMVEAGDDHLTLSSFDNSTSARVRVPCQVLDDGRTLVSGRLIADIARALPNRPIELTAEENQAHLVCGSSRFTLQTLPVDEYPVLPPMPEVVGSVDAAAFERAVAQVASAAGRDELLAVFTAIRLEILGDRLDLLATDRYRMALKWLDWSPAQPDPSGVLLVPGKVLSDTVKAMAQGEKITLSHSRHEGANMLGLESSGPTGSRSVVTQLLDGAFPKVRHLMDFEATLTVRGQTDELLAATKRVALVAERNTPLRMEIGEDQVSLTAATGDQAQGSESVAAEVGVVGDAPSIKAAGFNPAYLQDALAGLDAPYVQFSFTAPGKPCLISGLEELGADPIPDYRHVIMLMRLPD